MGRTRSITRTTVEHRGDVKIVRTTKTVITPSDLEDPYEGFDDYIEEEDFDRPMTPVDEDAELGSLSGSIDARTAAVGAAAAALGMKTKSPKMYRESMEVESMGSPKTPQRRSTAPVAPMVESENATSSLPSQHAHFNPTADVITYAAPPPTHALSHDYHAGNAQYPRDADVIYDTPLEDEEVDFDELRRNRLSEIAEVTEMLEDDPEPRRGPIDSIVVRQPVEDSLELDDTIDMGRTLETESEEEYVEASEVLETPPGSAQRNMRIPSVGLGLNVGDGSTSPAQHLYRNLMFGERTPVRNPARSPQKNSIPKFVGSSASANTSRGNSHANDSDSNGPFLETPPSSSDAGSKHKVVKPTLQVEKAEVASVTASTASTSRAAQTPEDMYAMALKAAERKVYGDRPRNSAPTAVKAPVTERKHSPKANSAASESASASASAPAPTSFRTHSLRSSAPTPAPPSTAKQLRKDLERQTNLEAKKWEEDRRRMLNNLTQAPQTSQPPKQTKPASKRNRFSIKKSPSHQRKVSVASEISQSSTLRERLFKRTEPQQSAAAQPSVERQPATKNESKPAKKSNFSSKFKHFFDLN